MKHIYLFAIITGAAIITACGGGASNTATNGAANTAKPGEQVLVVVERPARLVEIGKARGDQDKAAPTLKIVEPAANATVASSTVKVKLAISGRSQRLQADDEPGNSYW